MCLDDSHEAAARPLPPLVIIETGGILVEFYELSQRADALLLMVQECVKHGKPVAQVLYRDPEPRPPEEPIYVGVWSARWA